MDAAGLGQARVLVDGSRARFTAHSRTFNEYPPVTLQARRLQVRVPFEPHRVGRHELGMLTQAKRRLLLAADAAFGRSGSTGRAATGECCAASGPGQAGQDAHQNGGPPDGLLARTHAHLIELQISHMPEELPFLVLVSCDGI